MQKSSSLFLRKIEQFIEQKELMNNSQLYLVALSGGADSVALLLALKKLGYNIEAAHCNFHLRGEESDRDEDFCKNLCRELDIKLHLAHFDTQTNASLHGISIEMAARNLRYNYFETLLKDINASAVCVAHHKDDSAETLLLNLIRGTGIEGLTGIKSKNNRIVRPFLCVRRNEIINYLEQQNQSFVTDSSNLVNDVQRNKIRLDVMPLLQTINPLVVEHLNQTGEYVEEATAILNTTLEQMYNRVVLLKTEKQTIVDIERLEKEQSSSYLLWYILYRKRSEPTFTMSDTYAYNSIKKSWRMRILHLPVFLRIVTFICIVIILARPQTHNSWGNKSVEGIDIMLAMDVSTSMLAEDLKPNRMEAAKKVAAEFISDRANDNIGLTIFAGEAFTQCPMTTDHASLLNLLQGVRTDIASRGLIADGTAVGMGLANAVSRLKESKAKSKVIILLTDGSNNMGDISPLTAAQIAKSLGIRVYTIGVGTNTVAPYPVMVGGTTQYVNVPAEIDTKTLKDIAQSTDGGFYRATNNAELKEIYNDIDRLEKTKMDVKKFSKRYEAYEPFALIAILSLLLEILLRLTILRRIP